MDSQNNKLPLLSPERNARVIMLTVANVRLPNIINMATVDAAMSSRGSMSDDSDANIRRESPLPPLSIFLLW